MKKTKLPSLYFTVDVENLYIGVKDSFGRQMRIDFEKLLALAVRNRKLSRVQAVAHVVTDYTEVSKDFLGKIRRIGYRVMLDRATRKGESQVDVKLSVDVFRNIKGFDICVLGTGDGDFIELVHLLRERGKRVEVICVRSDIDRKYIEVVDAITFINEDVLYEVEGKK